MELQSGILQLAADRFDESIDVAVAGCLGGVELILDVVVDFFLRIFQRQVLQLRFQLVQAQLVGQRGIQVSRLVGYLQAGFLVVRVLYLAHQVHTVGNHDENHAHILGKGEEQVAEVFRLDGGTLGIQLVYLHQSADDAGHVLAVFLLHHFQRIEITLHCLVQHDAQDGSPFHTYLFGHDDGRLHIFQDGVHTEFVA